MFADRKAKLAMVKSSVVMATPGYRGGGPEGRQASLLLLASVGGPPRGGNGVTADLNGMAGVQPSVR